MHIDINPSVANPDAVSTASLGRVSGLNQLGRRSLAGAMIAFASITKAAANSAVAGGAAVPNDAEFLTACAAFMDANSNVESVNARSFGVTDKELAKASDAWNNALDLVTRLSPTTINGMRAKARVTLVVLKSMVAVRINDTFEDCAEPHEMLAWTLARDMIEHTPA